MAPSSDADEPNDVALSDPPTEDTTTTKKRKFLSRLPVKSLMQFKCVCKSWKSLISDPNFAKKHLRMSTKHHHLISINSAGRDELIHMSYPLSSLLTDVTATAIQLEYPLTNRYRRFDPIVASCHGILCIQIDHVSVNLWNPSIRKFTKIPSLEDSIHGYSVSFGYDHSSDTYKVVARGFVIKVHTVACKHLIPTTSWNIIALDLEKESYQENVQPDYGREYGNKESWIKLFRVPDIRDLGYDPYGTFKDVNIQNTVGWRGTQVYYESLISLCF
ncbi:hypothetical protein TSUD_381770 [Trifolium subterraneum]|uniref:F-box domain-containing protein n=1 Tax=Trifolium subterraneum TaxID=3900 RepID=A0A2Z6MV72_TRISU|nr:hypothetical protein TSUD_381770 [Trifolium subterraneum]